MKEITQIFRYHKAYVGVIAVLLFLLLLRIPLGTFNQNTTLDAISHILLPACAAPLGFVFLTRNGFFPEMSRMAGLLVIVLLGTGGEVLWEIFEFCIDNVFSLTWQTSNTDTMLDIISGVFGAAGGGFLYTKIYGTLFLHNKYVIK